MKYAMQNPEVGTEADFRWRAEQCRTNLDAYDATAASVWDLAADAVRERERELNVKWPDDSLRRIVSSIPY